jgi:Fe-S-cluster-containing dehydrogenase component/DMSO reductase anchor subunit
VLWRGVYEINGGEWKQSGKAWTSTVFAYNLSIACNHCVHPKCAGVCPVDAFEVRQDGIVLINTKKCIGCGYCAWACPYDAPQMDPFAGYMTKCNLCYDNLDADCPPACVAACPLRCLELVDTNNLGIEERGLALWKIPGGEHPFPLPKRSRTEPHLVIKPHPAAMQVGQGTIVSKRNDASPSKQRETAEGEIPLLFFTLLAQMAIGAFVTIYLIYLSQSDKLIAGQITFISLLAVGAGITGALLVSFFHLGTPKNAWRSINHLRKSWLSREILFTTGFAGLWAVITGLRIFQFGPYFTWISFSTLTAICGLVAVYSMQHVYQLRSIPAWNTNHTFLEFYISTVGLGCLLTGALLPWNADPGIITWIALVSLFVFSAATVASSPKKTENTKLHNWRVILLLGVLLGSMIIGIWPSTIRLGSMILVFFIAMAEETIGRWLFYSRRNPGI